MAAKEGVLFTWNDAIQGQLQVGVGADSGWIRTDPAAAKDGGFSEVLLKGTFTQSTGVTAIFVDESFDGQNVAYSSSDQFASVNTTNGVKVNVAGPWVRIRITQTTAATTAAKFSAKASD